MYDPERAVNSQAFAYKSKKTGDIKPLSTWSILEYVEEEDEIKSDFIEIVKLKESAVQKGRVSFKSDKLDEAGLEVGDIVGFAKNLDYRFSLDEKEYYRTRIQDLMYKELWHVE